MKTGDLVEILTGMQEFDRMGTVTLNPKEQICRRSRLLPPVQALTARDFKVCEECGGPAMLHPRFEMAQTLAGDKGILCCDCLHEAVFPTEVRARSRHGLRIGDQLWKCHYCGNVRAWGLSQPWDSAIRPVLVCRECDRPTRHVFKGVAGRA
jgi:hypothetical protein